MSNRSNVILPGRYVVCAANRWDDIIVCGVRHFDMLMHGQIKYITEKYGVDRKSIHWEQGFVDQHGVFMDRYEALTVARNAGQLNVRREKTSPVDRLFSEDLY